MPEPFDALPALERWLARSLDRERTPGAFDLEAIRRLALGLGEPQRAYRVIQVAGTKGKGTTSAAAASILDACGRRVGLYTSPHLVDLRERIRLGAGPAPDAAWLRAGARVRQLVDDPAWSGARPSWFELVTAIALLVFEEAGVEVAVLEVGLGGRLDATSVCRPDVSVITRIGLDHTELLGHTVAAIAGEKAAILRAGVPAVVGPQHPDAERVVQEQAAQVGAPLWSLERELTLAERGDALELSTPAGRFRLPAAPDGGVGRRNHALAVAACARLAAAAGWELPVTEVEAGLRRLRWRGRQELFPGQPPLLIDGAHQPDSARALQQARLARLGPGPYVLLLAIARDKLLAQVLAELAPDCALALCCRGGQPRAAEPAALAEGLRALGVEARPSPLDPAGALAAAREEARARGLPLVVAGSLYLAGGALAALGEDTLAAWETAPAAVRQP